MKEFLQNESGEFYIPTDLLNKLYEFANQWEAELMQQSSAMTVPSTEQEEWVTNGCGEITTQPISDFLQNGVRGGEQSDSIAPNNIPNDWRVTKFGQIKTGDVISLVCGDKHICTTAKEILNAGTNREEVIYNRKKNHYFITSMVLDGTSMHKHVFIVPNPAIAQCEG